MKFKSTNSIYKKAILLLTFVITLILWLLLTESGLKLSFWILKPLLPGIVSTANISGTLTSTITIDQLKYQKTTPILIDLDIKKLKLIPYLNGFFNKRNSIISFEIVESSISLQTLSSPIQLKQATGELQLGKNMQFSFISINNIEGSWKNMPLSIHGKLGSQFQATRDANLWITLGENQLQIFQNPNEAHRVNWKLSLKDTDFWKADLEGFMSNQQCQDEWQGSLTQLNSNSELLGKWTLEKPCPIKISSTEFSLSPLELSHQNKVKAKALFTWSKVEGLNTEIEIPTLPIQHPKYLLQGNASFMLKATQKPNAKLKGEVKLTLSPGNIRLNKSGKAPKIISFAGGLFHLQLTEDLLEGNLDFKQNSNNFLNASFKSNASTNTQPLLLQPLLGKFSIDYNDLSLINLFLPQISRLKSTIKLEGTVAGTLKAPLLAFEANAKNISFYIPKQAIQINRLNINLNGQFPGELQLNGSGFAGNGAFTLKAKQKTESLPAFTVELTGKNMQIYDTSYIKAKATPDLKLHFLRNALHVEGTVKIMDSSITIKDEKNIINASKDIIYINHENPIEEEPGFQIIPSLYLVLENTLHFKGYGLDGNIGGKLAIEKRPDGLLSGTGRLTIKEGKYRLQGATRYIYRGYLLFPPGTLLMDPILDIRILQKRVDINENKGDFGIYVQGTLRKPFFNPYSNSNLHSQEIMSRLGFGNSQASNDESQKQLLSQTAFLLAGSANPFIDLFQSQFELEEFNIESRETQKSFNTQGGTDTVIILGKSLSKKLYLQYLQSVLEPISTVRLRYSISPLFSTSIETGTEGLGGDLTFSLEKD